MHEVKGNRHFDIREYKKEIRNKYKKIRVNMQPNEKEKKDSNIFSRLVNLDIYIKSEILITYVSTDIEVDTIMLIKHALNMGKTIAVPKCIGKTGKMVFYIINSLKQLSPGAFSVLEPDPNKCIQLTKFKNSICIVPALVYDLYGYRLGYGKGYYDRFISTHPSIFKIGIGYCCCTVNKLIIGRYDKPVDLLITEKYVKRFNI